MITQRHAVLLYSVHIIFNFSATFSPLQASPAPISAPPNVLFPKLLRPKAGTSKQHRISA